MTKKYLTILLSVLLLTASGCRMIMRQMKPNFYAGNDAFIAAESVKSKVGAPFRVQKIVITEDKFTMDVESPANPRNVDEYTYIGIKAVGPNPLPFSQSDAKEVDKMPVDEIDFTVIPQVVEKALEKAQIEGGKVKEIIFYTKTGEKFGWDVNVQGTREGAWVFADMKGNIIGANLSQTARAADYRIINEAELTRASDAIKAKFGADAKISNLRIDERHVSFTAKNPDNPQENFNYAFGIDGLKKTSPIALPDGMMSEIKTLAFNEINLVDFVSLSRRAKEKLGMPDGEINSISFYRMPVLVKKPVSPRMPDVMISDVSPEARWTVDVKQGAKKGRAEYDAKFNEIPVAGQ